VGETQLIVDNLGMMRITGKYFALDQAQDLITLLECRLPAGPVGTSSMNWSPDSTSAVAPHSGGTQCCGPPRHVDKGQVQLCLRPYQWQAIWFCVIEQQALCIEA